MRTAGSDVPKVRRIGWPPWEPPSRRRRAAGLRLRMDAATVVSWSLGVNVAFELALEDPARVSGLLAVAGVPGGSYSSLFANYGVPRRLLTPIGRLSSRLLPVVGPLLPVVLASVPPWHDLLTPAAARGPAKEATHPAALGKGATGVLPPRLDVVSAPLRRPGRSRATGRVGGALPRHVRGGPLRFPRRHRRRPGRPPGPSPGHGFARSWARISCRCSTST